MAENEAIDLFLYAAKLGLFEMDWHLVCPSCGHVIDNFNDLSAVHPDAVCDVCCLAYEAFLDDYIQVTFTISPQIRDIVFRHPEALSVEDFYLKYHLAKGMMTPDGTPLSDALRSLTRVMTYLSPGETTSAQFELIPGLLSGTDVLNKTSITLFTSQNQDKPSLSLKVREGKFQMQGEDLPPAVNKVDDSVVQSQHFGEIGIGTVQLEVQNLMPNRCAVWLMNLPMALGKSENRPQLAPFLSGKRLLTTQTFRDLFRSEVMLGSEGIGIRDITFLFTDLKGSTAMYDAVGDPKAYYLVRQHFDTLGRVIARHGGAIVKTIGDAVMATFLTPVDALQAGLDMLDELEAFNRTIGEDLILKIGIHRGHCIAVNLNERQDYFGQAVNIAARVQALADADEIYLSQAAYNFPGIPDVLASHHVASEQANVKGVREALQVFKVVRASAGSSS
jgi:class 3 adenylate cyclase